MSDEISQIGILLTGVVAVFLTQSRSSENRRYACIFGLLGQPFWFHAAIVAEQWGIFIVCCLYAWAWLKGFWVHWLSRRVCHE